MHKSLIQAKHSYGKRNDAVEDDMHYFARGFAVLILKRLQFSKFLRKTAMHCKHSNPDDRSRNTDQKFCCKHQRLLGRVGDRLGEDHHLIVGKFQQFLQRISVEHSADHGGKVFVCGIKINILRSAS